MKNWMLFLLLPWWTNALAQAPTRDIRRELYTYRFSEDLAPTYSRTQNYRAMDARPEQPGQPVVLELPAQRLPFSSNASFFSFSVAWNEASDDPTNSRFFISFAPDSLQWSAWQPLPADDHALDIRHTSASELVFCPPDRRFFKVRVETNRSGMGEIVQDMLLNAFSPGAKGSLSMDVPEKVGLGEPCACPQPAFVSRKGWSCPQGTTSPGYTTVTHLIVHHAAGTNISNDWAGVVLAIWNLHVYTNGWADVGYNWLIAPDGTLFEGRGGGDNVTGAHFCGKNSGTMGVCMLGTYTSTELPAAAKSTLIATLGWKACQRNLDPVQVSYHNSTQTFLSNISGHRDGCSTECPGDQVYKLLPTLRQAVLDFGLACQAVSNLEYTLPGVASCRLYPNPGAIQSHIQCALQLSTRLALSYRLLDSEGQVVYTHPAQDLMPGAHTLRIAPPQDLPSGEYFLQLWANGKQQTIPFSLF